MKSKYFAKTTPRKREITKKKKKKEQPKSKKINLNERRTLAQVLKCGNEKRINMDRALTTSTECRGISMITNNVFEHVIQILNMYARGRIVVGCVAWMSSTEIIDALSMAKRVAIIVNDEDYSKWGHNTVTPEKYSSLKGFGLHSGCTFSQTWKRKIPHCPLTFAEFDRMEWDAVRCYGQTLVKEMDGVQGRSGGALFSSIMHAKYLVICNDNDMPEWIWTGSINFTANSANNLEIGFLIHDPKLAMAAFYSFCVTFMNSGRLRY